MGGPNSVDPQLCPALFHIIEANPNDKRWGVEIGLKDISSINLTGMGMIG